MPLGTKNHAASQAANESAGRKSGSSLSAWMAYSVTNAPRSQRRATPQKIHPIGLSVRGEATSAPTVAVDRTRSEPVTLGSTNAASLGMERCSAMIPIITAKSATVTHQRIHAIRGDRHPIRMDSVSTTS